MIGLPFPDRQVLELGVAVPMSREGVRCPCCEVRRMAVDLPPVPDVAAIIAPQEIEKKKGGGRARTTAIAIGTVLILSDGSECVVVGFDAQGNPICQPTSP